METTRKFAAPESTPCGMGWRASIWMTVWSVVAGAAIIASSLLLKHYAEMGSPLRMAVALAPIVPFAAMFIVMVRSARRLDELNVRIQMEALSMTVIITIVLAVAWGQLQKAGFVQKGELSEIWPVMVLVYAGCLATAMRRYQ